MSSNDLYMHQTSFNTEPFRKPKEPFVMVLPKSQIEDWTKRFGHNCGFDPERVIVRETPLFDKK